MPHPRAGDDGEPYARRWLALPSLGLGCMLLALDITIVGVAAATLSQDLKATTSEIQWSFDAYTVALASLVLLGGGLAERFGRKGCLLLGFAVFIAGSTVSAFANDVTVLIVGRAISGVGGAFVFPAMLSVVSAMFPKDERPHAIGIWAAFGASGLALGPVVGGLLLDHFWFGSIFLVNVPVGLIAMLLAAVLVPPSKKPGRTPLDLAGVVLSIFALGGLIYGVIEGPEQGWSSTPVLVAFAAFLVGTIAFVRWELSTSGPLVDLRVLTLAPVVTGALSMSIVYMTFQGMQLLIPQYLQFVENLSALHTGMVMTTSGVVFGLLSTVSHRIVDRYGQRAILTLAMAVMAAGMATLGLLDTWGGLANVLAGICIYSLGFGMVVAPATAAIMVALPQEKAGDGSAVNIVSRQIGGAVGVAVLGSITSAVYRYYLTETGLGLNAEQIDQVESSLSGALALGKTIDPAVAAKLDTMADASLVHGLTWALLVGAAATAVASVTAFFALKGETPVAAE